MDNIVTKETFAQAQAVLRHISPKKPPRRPYQKFRGLVKCAYCGRALVRTICKSKPGYFCCPTARTVKGRACTNIYLEEAVLEDALLTAIQTQVQLFMDAVPETEEDTEGHLQEGIKACQSAASRNKTLQAVAFEDYAEGRIGKHEYLSRKQEIAGRQEETKARFAELAGQLAQLQGQPEKTGTDLGKYAFVKELSREMLVELVKEVRVSEKDTLEIQWNFREQGFQNDEKDK